MKFPHIPQDLTTAAQIFQRAGYQCWLVGGAVRDQLLNRYSNDFDLATNAVPEQVIRLFHRTIPTGIKHGTVTILLGSHQFETTTFRCDGNYHDGRRPDNITYTIDIREDLARRDFTINAIAWDVINKKLLDPHNGREDLKNRVIRAIGDPKTRFEEDKLRVIRACRFAAQLDFSIAPETLKAIEPSMIMNLSVERIWDELKKTVTSPKPSVAFRLFRDTDLLRTLLPELADCVGAPLHKTATDVFDHCLNVCDLVPADNLHVRTAALLHDIGKPRTAMMMQENGKPAYPNHAAAGASIAKDILSRLKASKQDVDVVTRLVQHHTIRYSEDWNDAEVRRFMMRIGIDILDNLMTLRQADSISSPEETAPESGKRLIERIDVIRKRNDALQIKDLAIDGHVLMKEFDLMASPSLGLLLQYLLRQVVENPEFNQRDTLIGLSREWINDHTP